MSELQPISIETLTPERISAAAAHNFESVRHVFNSLNNSLDIKRYGELEFKPGVLDQLKRDRLFVSIIHELGIGLSEITPCVANALWFAVRDILGKRE